MPIDIRIARESEKLDLKEQYGFLLPVDDSLTGSDSKKYLDGQWDEFAKDFIALSNGGINNIEGSSYLVVGVREVRDGDNIPMGRNLTMPPKERIVARLKERILPSVPEFIIHTVQDGDESYSIIEIPTVSTVLHSSRIFQTYSVDKSSTKGSIRPKTTYSKHAVFYRLVDTVDVASPAVIDYLKFIKFSEGEDRIANINFEVSTSLVPLMYGSSSRTAVEYSDLVKPYLPQDLSDLPDQIKFEAGLLSDIILYIPSIQNYVLGAHYETLFSILNDARFKRYIETHYKFSDVFFDRVRILREAHSALIMKRQLFTDENFKLFKYSVRKMRGDKISLPSHELLVPLTALMHMRDVIILSLGIIAFFRGQYDKFLTLTPQRWLFPSADTQSEPDPVTNTQAYIESHLKKI